MAKKIFRDGRVKLTRDDYAEAKRLKWEEQKKACAICGLFVPIARAELDHIGGRGMGGAKRDDRPEFTRILHSYCHRLHHYKNRDGAAKVRPTSE